METTHLTRSPIGAVAQIEEDRQGGFPQKLFLLLAETFQALSDSTRVQIVWALSKGELSVGTIAKVLKISQPTVSHHLRTLRNLKLVKVRKKGVSSLYSLDDQHIENIMDEGIEHVRDFL